VSTVEVEGVVVLDVPEKGEVEEVVETADEVAFESEQFASARPAKGRATASPLSRRILWCAMILPKRSRSLPDRIRGIGLSAVLHT
jgi:hypothetical protein